MRQYEAALDSFQQALNDCPPELWEAHCWVVKRDDPWLWPRNADGTLADSGERTEEMIQVFGAFWYVAYHCLFFLDFYLTQDAGSYAMPEPFGGGEEHGVDEHGLAVLPYRIYTKDELLGYLRYGREKARSVIPALTEEEVKRIIPKGHPWAGVTFNQLLRVNLQHVKEHGTQLEKVLRKNKVQVAN